MMHGNIYMHNKANTLRQFGIRLVDRFLRRCPASPFGQMPAGLGRCFLDIAVNAGEPPCAAVLYVSWTHTVHYDTAGISGGGARFVDII